MGGGPEISDESVCRYLGYPELKMKMRMYILIRESVPVGKAITAAAHASLACYLKFPDHPATKQWLDGPAFFKVVCKVTDEEFEKAKEENDYVIITESTLGDDEVAIVFLPRKEYPSRFKFFRLYK